MVVWDEEEDKRNTLFTRRDPMVDPDQEGSPHNPEGRPLLLWNDFSRSDESDPHGSVRDQYGWHSGDSACGFGGSWAGSRRHNTRSFDGDRNITHYPK